MTTWRSYIRKRIGDLDRLWSDHRGLALIEFAIVLPVILLLYLGGYQLMDAIACNRKVTITARDVTDLVSRSTNSTVYKANIDSALNASAQIMYPYNSGNALIRVSEITTDNNGNGTVTWSRAINGSALVPNATFILPSTIRANNISLIYSEVYYNYTPYSTFAFAGKFNLAQTVYMAPRSFSTLTCQDC